MAWLNARSLALPTILLQLSATLVLTWSASANPPRRPIRLTFQPPKGLGAPKTTTGAGSRAPDRCQQDVSLGTRTPDKILLPVLRSPNLQSIDLTRANPAFEQGLTISAHPTFLVYVPSTSAQHAEFRLVSFNGTEVYRTRLNLQGPGIIPVSLPASGPPLEVGKDYRWVVSLVCQPNEAIADSPYVMGLIRRVAPTTTLPNLSPAIAPLDRIQIYARAGIWYEAIADLAALKRDRPADPTVAMAWHDLLDSAGLGAIAQAPLRN